MQPDQQQLSATGTIRITVDQPDGKAPIVITIDSGTHSAVQADTASPAIAVTSAHPAAVAVQQPSNEPSTAVLVSNLSQGTSPAAQELSATTSIYETLDHALREAFAKDMQTIDKDIFTLIQHEVAKVMKDLLEGSALLTIPADDITAIQKEITSSAHMIFKSQGADAVNFGTIKQAIQKSPKIAEFEKKHKAPKDKATDTKHPAHHAVGDHDKHKLHHHGTVEAAPELAAELSTTH